MSVSSVLLSRLRFFERTENQTTPLPSQDIVYASGTRFRRTLEHDKSSSLSSIFNLMETLNSEPLFAGNGVFLLNRQGVFSDIGGPLTASQAIVLLECRTPIIIRLARARPAPDAHIRLVPMKDFTYQIDSPEQLKSWWQKVGCVFFDCGF